MFQRSVFLVLSNLENNCKPCSSPTSWLHKIAPYLWLRILPVTWMVSFLQIPCNPISSLLLSVPQTHI